MTLTQIPVARYLHPRLVYAKIIQASNSEPAINRLTGFCKNEVAD